MRVCMSVCSSRLSKKDIFREAVAARTSSLVDDNKGRER